ncbi:HD domain-containing phosphohydrolase [Candidatus Neomarinimicrobiota bacterium]
MNDKVLFVDDEPHVLASYERQLRGSYNIETALGGDQALVRINESEPFAVIISDQKMPKMDGIELLTRVHEIAPDTVRVMLTGHADLETAIEAVNCGYIFRFLTKPCPPEALALAVEAGIEQHKLILAGRELHTLMKLKNAMEGIILGFSTIVETRDPYTAGHQERVTRLAVAIAGVMGLDEDQTAALRLAAMVHDIGKIYVPADFLNKPGKLSDVEYSILWTHPTIGRDILKSVDFVWPISEIVVQHHERMNGSGYPKGLSGDDIYIEARILSVADVIDAMDSHRPYRPSLGMEKALEEIEFKRGSHFDSNVVDACVKLIREQDFQLFD